MFSIFFIIKCTTCAHTIPRTTKQDANHKKLLYGRRKFSFTYIYTSTCVTAHKKEQKSHINTATQPKTKHQHTNRTIHNHHTNTNQNHFQRQTATKSEQTLYISFILSIPTKKTHTTSTIFYTPPYHIPQPHNTLNYT